MSRIKESDNELGTSINSKLTNKLEFVGNSVGAQDFSPDWKHRYFGTEVPCPDNDKHQFLGLCAQTLGRVWQF